MKVIVAGSRDVLLYYEDGEVYRLITQGMTKLGICDFGEISCILSGACRGVDRLGERWARYKDIHIERYPADWDKYGKAAGPIRNQQMVDLADALIVIRFPESRGSKDILNRAKKKGIPVVDIILEHSDSFIEDIMEDDLPWE